MPRASSKQLNAKGGNLTAIAPVSNDGEDAILSAAVLSVSFRIEGVSAILFHRWSNEEVAAKAAAPKSSKTKKEDAVESYVWRDADGILCLPGEYIRMAMVGAARYRQDPRSSIKSAMDLYKAGIMWLDEFSPIRNAGGELAATWDYLDQRRVRVQRSAVTRSRPAMTAGWNCDSTFQINTPEYISPTDFLACLQDAGKLVGVGDFRPSYGRFVVTNFEVL